jgi:predicted RNase H-like HicB family nuclease
MGKREYHVLIEKDSDCGFIGTAPQLRDCSARGRNLDELMANMRKAIQLARVDDDLDLDSGFIGVYKLEVEVEER